METVSRRFLGEAPRLFDGYLEHVGVALDFDQSAKMSVPILGADAPSGGPRPGQALLNPVMATRISWVW